MAEAECNELIADARRWAQTFPRSSKVRRLLHALADALEGRSGRARPEAGITAAAVEEAMGGKSLLPWQRKALGGDDE